MAEELATRLYEIRIIKQTGEILIFATVAATDDEAAGYAQSKMVRHGSDTGEVWCEMKLVRRM